ncbi:MAG: TonB family protein [Candidatus Polarisedimenticolia bacterium]
MSERSPITSREAVLSSLLLHALVFITILLNPGLFTARAVRPASTADPNGPIPLEFLQEPPPRDEVSLGDPGQETRSDPRPPDAPPPRNDDPYSRGNVPNRFLAPPVSGPAVPEPDAPASPGQEAPDTQPEQEPADENPPRADARTPGKTEDPFGGTSAGQPEGAPGGRRGQRSLKEALGRMSAGHPPGGLGEPLRYDNPVGGLSGPTGGLSFDTPGFDWGPYARRIYWIIWTNWTRGWPPAARAGLSGVVTVRFRIERDGRVTGISVVDESGTPAFDTCATLALEASNPLPPLPEDFPKDSEGITARFLYNMEPYQR